MRIKLLIISFVLISLLLSDAALAMSRRPNLEIRPEQMSPAIDFSLLDLDGNVVSLSNYLGKIVLLNFWRVGCSSCRDQMPYMQRLYNELKGEAFEILAVSIDKRESSLVKKFIQENGYTFKVLLDPRREVASQYGILWIPTTFIIDKNGMILSKVIGPRDWVQKSVIAEFRKLIQE